MTEQVPKTLRCAGAQSVQHAVDLVVQGQALVLELPPDSHHALATRLATSGQPVLDVSGGAELVEKVAQVRGLEALAGLAAAVNEHGATVRVTSPSPHLHITPQG